MSDEHETNNQSEKTIKFVASNPDAAVMRQEITEVADACGLRIAASTEKRSRMSTTFTVTVAGDFGRIEDFHDSLRGDAWSDFDGGNIFVGFVVSTIVDGLRATRRKWRGWRNSRHDSKR